jgi:hypothetical protein
VHQRLHRLSLTGRFVISLFVMIQIWAVAEHLGTSLCQSMIGAKTRNSGLTI